MPLTFFASSLHLSTNLLSIPSRRDVVVVRWCLPSCPRKARGCNKTTSPPGCLHLLYLTHPNTPIFSTTLSFWQRCWRGRYKGRSLFSLLDTCPFVQFRSLLLVIHTLLHPSTAPQQANHHRTSAACSRRIVFGCSSPATLASAAA